MDYPKAPRGSAAEATFRSLRRLGIEYAGATAEGGRFRCPNPGHEDERPSCDVTIGRKGKPLFNCKPCEQAMGQAEYIEALRSHGVNWSGAPCSVEDVDWGAPAVIAQVRVAKEGQKGDVRLSAVYTYNHADGSPNFKVKRYDPTEGSTVAKQFRPRRYVKGEGWVSGLDGTERTPYYLDRFEEWAGGVLYLVEGEKACDALVEVGRAATTFHGGAAGKVEDDWPTRYGFGRFAQVRVWPDADEAGVLRARALCEALCSAGVNAVVWGVPAGALLPKDDAFDVIQRGLTGKGHMLSDSELDALSALHRLPVRKATPPEGQKRPADGPKVAGKVLVSAEPYGGAGGAVEDGDDGVTDYDPTGPYPVAAIQQPDTFTGEYLARHYTDAEGVLTLRYLDLRFWLWCGTHFRPLLPEEVRARLSNDLRGQQETAADGPRPITLNNRLKAEVLGALMDRTLVSEHGAGQLLPCSGGVPFRNGWLDVATGELTPLSPERDVRWVVPGDYDPEAPEPKAFLGFLDSIGFTEDSEERRLLRQWMGYLLSGQTNQQKALMLVGPPRAGKGTILKVCEAMLGEGAVGIDLSAFSTNFGLSPIIGKSLATVDDARFEMKTDKALVRRILSLVAEGTMTIDRKHKDPVSIRATARLMMATNEIPALIEASEALSTRFLFLKFSESFLHREDLDLEKRVLRELPGIVKWALAGMDDLNQTRRFAETAAGRDMQREMTEIANPIRIFIEEECVLDGGAFTSTDELHAEFAVWADQRRYYVPSPVVFARDLNAAYPDSVMKPIQKRVGSKVRRGFVGVRIGR